MSGVALQSRRSDSLTRLSLEDHVSGIAWGPGGALVAAVALSGPTVVASAATGEEKWRFEPHQGGNLGVAWSSDGTLLATGGADGLIRLWDATTGVLWRILGGGGAWVEHMAWSDDGARMASAAGKTVRVWTPRGEMLHHFDTHESTVTGLQWSAQGRAFATACYEPLTANAMPKMTDV